MLKILKITLILIVGLTIAAAEMFWVIGSTAASKADATDIRPSQRLQMLVTEYLINLPSVRDPDCGDWRYWNSGNGSKIAASLEFNSLVDEARSAESAALRYKEQGDNKMASIATLDAVERWRRVWELKGEMNCYDIQIKRGSY